MEATSDPAQIVRDFWLRVWVDGELAALDELVADPITRHNVDGTVVLTLEAFRNRIADALRTVCGSEVSFDAMTAEGDEVWARITLRGMTLATMSPLVITWIAQYRFESGKIAEMWALHRSGIDWNE